MNPNIHQLRRREPRSGFTLLELLAVITIVAILASVAFIIGAGLRKKAERVQCGRLHLPTVGEFSQLFP